MVIAPRQARRIILFVGSVLSYSPSKLSASRGILRIIEE